MSKYIKRIGLHSYEAQEITEQLTLWRGDLSKQKLPLFIRIRADAGTYFTSDEFTLWCKENNIKLEIAGPKHQEQNAFVKRSYQTISRMAWSMLVLAHLLMKFYLPALDYACKILRVLPAKGLVDKEGKLTTPYAIMYGMKPHIARYKVFRCPVVFKKYKPMINGKPVSQLKQLPRGCRGIFIGLPANQAG